MIFYSVKKGMDFEMKKCLKKGMILCLCVLVLSANSTINVKAAETVSLEQADPAWQNQQIILELNGTSWSVPVVQLADKATAIAFLNQVNAQLAAYVFETADPAGNVQKQCYQLNDTFRDWLMASLQSLMTQPPVGQIRVNLLENHLKIVTVGANIGDLSTYILAGGCETSYSTSSRNRCNNVEVAAERLNNMVVAPGQVVSVDQAILPRTASNGYKEAGAYSEGKVVPAIGGGICQVSSTVYNAVMNAGLTVIERRQHSMPVHYLPLGQDAAISSGTMDLKFRNDYQTPVLIQTKTQDKKLTVTVYVSTLSLQGRSYKFWAKQTGGLSAVSYLTTYLNGTQIQTVKVANSSYKPMKAEAEED